MVRPLEGAFRPFHVSALLVQQPKRFAGPLGYYSPPEIQIECAAFQGSLAALVQCVAVRKVDLTEVPLHPICSAYIDYLLEAKEPDLDGAASALLALCYLVERKADRLLPQPEIESGEEDEFARDYPSFEGLRPALAALNERWDERDQLHFRAAESDDPGLYELPVALTNVSISDLGRALEKLLERAIPEKFEPLGRPRRSLSEQMNVVRRCLRDEPAPLEELIEGELTRLEAVWWFLALLELIRLGQANVTNREDGAVVFWRSEVPCN